MDKKVVRSLGSLLGYVVCLAINGLVAYAIFNSSYGSVFFMSDDERSSIFWIPLLVGVLVGFLQTLSFGPRVTIFAIASSALLGIGIILMLATIWIGAVGGLIGCLAGSTYRLWRPEGLLLPRTALLLISAGAIVTSVVAALTPTYDDLDRVIEPASGPSLLVHVEDRPYMNVDDPPYPPSTTGKLANVHGCLGIVEASPTPNKGEASPSIVKNAQSGVAIVIWPYGTTVTANPYRVTIRGRSYHLGQSVTVGGGYFDMIKEDPFYRQAPPSCRRDIFIG